MQVKRLGKYKAGNLLLRQDMSEEDTEVYTSLLEGIHSHFVTTVAKVPSLHAIHTLSGSRVFSSVLSAAAEPCERGGPFRKNSCLVQ
jgi:hypothetical protein